MRQCKNQKIISKCYHTFEIFSNFGNTKLFRLSLESANTMLPNFCNEELCFKFFKGDTLIWTVNDIINESNPKNIELLNNSIETCLTEKSLQIFINKL